MSRIKMRLSKLEQDVANRTEKPPVCNCRESTRYHSSVCLNELLKKMPRVCQVHGFRDLGVCLWVTRQVRLIPEDKQFCPCFVNPLRAFFQGPGPQTLEGLEAALDACRKVPVADPTDFLVDVDLAQAMLDQYDAARNRWLLKMGGKLASRRERKKLQLQEERKVKEVLSQLRRESMEQLYARTPV